MIYQSKKSLIFIFVIFCLCVGLSFQSQRKTEQEIVILISFDGFRWDYFEKTETPNFDALISRGVRAESLIPVFPSKTFPNHFSIVTGLYPENHGLIANTMYEPKTNSWYRIGQGSQAVTEGSWYEGEPVWVTVEKEGKTSAVMYWPGSEAEINGFRPSEYHVYNHKFPYGKRIKQVLEWLKKPPRSQPCFIGLYFPLMDDFGHQYGPDSTAIFTAIQELDTRIGQLVKGINKLNLSDRVNIIMVSDHGMASLSPDRVIYLSDYVDPKTLTIVNTSPFLDILTDSSKTDSIYTLLKNAHPHLQLYKKEDIPEEFHYSQHHRIPPIVGFADLGWSIIKDKNDFKPSRVTGGNHGFDPVNKEMHGIFVAAGPSFKQGVHTSSFRNIEIYNLITHILDIPPAPNDGNLENVKHVLRNP